MSKIGKKAVIGPIDLIGDWIAAFCLFLLLFYLLPFTHFLQARRVKFPGDAKPFQRAFPEAGCFHIY